MQLEETALAAVYDSKIDLKARCHVHNCDNKSQFESERRRNFYDFLYLSVSKACRKLENTCKLSHQKSSFLLRFSAAHGLRDEDGGAGT